MSAEVAAWALLVFLRGDPVATLEIEPQATHGSCETSAGAHLRDRSVIFVRCVSVEDRSGHIREPYFYTGKVLTDAD